MQYYNQNGYLLVPYSTHDLSLSFKTSIFTFPNLYDYQVYFKPRVRSHSLHALRNHFSIDEHLELQI